MPKDDNVIVISDHATSFVGHDSVKLYQACVLESSLRLYAKTGMIPTRGMTITKLLALATSFTGKAYKRGEHLKAAADVATWHQTMLAGLLVEDRRS